MINKSLKLINIGNLVSYNSKKEEMASKKDLEIVIKNEKIIEIGKSLNDADEIFDCENKLVTPGFIDCHTHPVFFENRSKEFEMRIKGKSYEEIAQNGGGINNNVKNLRKSKFDELKQKVHARMDTFLRLGTTTIEAKSGYGLNLDAELKSLEVLDYINSNHDIDIISTFMGAHAIPEEYKNNPDGYIDYLCNVMIPEVSKQGVAKYNDVFCEDGYFNLEQTQKILQKGLDYGLLPRIHADEFKNLGGSSLAGKMKCISADHLMNINDQDISSMVESNIPAVLLPGTTFFLGKSNYAPYLKIKNSGIDVAIATDYNPGSSNIQSMVFIIALATIYMKMDIYEAIQASTYIPSKLLNIDSTVGSIEIGKKADIILWNIKEPIDIPYNFSINPVKSVIKNGKILF